MLISLQHTATHCNTPQHTATHCNTPQHTATHCNTLQHTASHCNTLQHTAARRSCTALGCCCTTFQCDTVWYSVCLCVAVSCSVWQRAAVCCRVLQCSLLQSVAGVAVWCDAFLCVAVCCSVLQCDIAAVRYRVLQSVAMCFETPFFQCCCSSMLLHVRKKDPTRSFSEEPCVSAMGPNAHTDTCMHARRHAHKHQIWCMYSSLCACMYVCECSCAYM